ncbi:MAG: hypothetical protein V5A43_03030 [Haloarculaceae archaeon]
MNRNALVVLLVAAAMITVPVGALAADGVSPDGANQVNEDGTENASVAPGQMLAGNVDVGEAEIEGEIEARSFGITVAKAETDDATADVVSKALDSVEGRLNELEARKQALDRARENGSISEGEYRARITGLAAETANVKRLANASGTVSEGLPAEVLAARGIDVTAIQTLQDRASELRGPQVAEIARGIAGENVDARPGGPAAGDRGGQPGDVPGGEPGDASDGEPTEVPGGEPSDAPGDQPTDVPDGQPTDGGDVPTDGGTATTPPTNATAAPDQAGI